MMSFLLCSYGFIFVRIHGIATVCQTGTYNYFGDYNDWEVCNVRNNEAWIQSKTPNVGNYDMLSICQQLGYTSVYQRRSVCSYRCSYCSSSTSCSNPESWNTMWPTNSYKWISTSYISGNNIAWVCQGIKGEPSRYILYINI